MHSFTKGTDASPFYNIQLRRVIVLTVEKHGAEMRLSKHLKWRFLSFCLGVAAGLFVSSSLGI